MKKTIIIALGVSLMFLLNGCKSDASIKDGASQSVSKGTGNGYDLKFNLKPGTSYFFKSEIEQNTETMGMKSKSEIDATYSYLVKGAKDGNLILEVIYDKMEGSVEAMGSKTKYSSDDKGAGSGVYGAFVGKPLNITVTKTGKIISIDNVDFLNNSKGFSKDDLTQSMGMSMDIYPDHPVKIGDSWTKETESKFQNLSMKLISNYKLVSVAANVATLQMSGEIKMDQNVKAQEGMQMKLGGSQEGVLKIDISSGMAISGDLNQKIKGELNMQGNAMPLSMDSKIKLSGTEK